LPSGQERNLHFVTDRTLVDGFFARGVVIQAIGAGIELVGEWVVVDPVFAPFGAIVDVDVPIDTVLHPVAHLIAIERLGDLGAAAGGRQKPNPGQSEDAQRSSE
jgi:hypothetical protein